MWKHKEDQESEALGKSAGGPGVVPAGRPEAFRGTAQPGGTAHIGKSVVIKGELSGSEDLYLDGTVEGTIELRGNNLVVGPNGRVRAGIRARGVTIEGKVDGDIEASERVELRKTAVLTGNIVTQRVAIEDGAYFKGGVDVNRQAAHPQAHVRPETKHEAAPPVAHPRGDGKQEAAPVTASASAAGSAAGGSTQTRSAQVEQKKS